MKPENFHRHAPAEAIYGVYYTRLGREGRNSWASCWNISGPNGPPLSLRLKPCIIYAMSAARKPLCLGIGGGSGSGKSGLAHYVARRLGRRAVIVCQDWYYRDNGNLSIKQSRRLNFDHPSAIETPLLCRQLDGILGGKPIDAPRYDYATHARLKQTRVVEPAALVILEGLLVLHDKKLRDRMDCSVFIDVPDDLRLLRRIRRDVEHRRVNLEETLRLYEHCVRPMQMKFIGPAAARATFRWHQLDDDGFKDRVYNLIKKRLSR